MTLQEHKGIALVALIAVVAGFVLGGWWNAPKKLPAGEDGLVSAAGNMLAEDYIPYVMYNGGWNSNKDATFGGTVTGAASSWTTASFSTSATIGSSGTAVAGLVAGTCTIWSSSATIAASTTQQVECQSATTGGLTTTLSGVTTDSKCSLSPALTALNSIAGLGLHGYVASSTDAGTITATLGNGSGSQFTWTATASSSWQYICVDPA